jgi:mannose-6-phosphate isomerase
MIEAKPYKLYSKIQNYDWGTVNENAFIPNLLGSKPVKDLPYAELWIGAHPKASSEILINEKKYSLNEIIANHPDEILGNEIADKFENKLPFLLKVLSSARALSIQTHPNKEQAEKLHADDPLNYPDDNHKPEIAIAVDSLSAIAGFRHVNEIVENLRENPELEFIVGRDFINKILIEKNENELQNLVKELYALLMKKSEDKEILKTAVEKIVARLTRKNNLKQEEKQFLKQYKNFGADIGLLSFFFFNIINLKPGQAIFTGAGTPHAYLEGNIVECMANSDNVVRAGLTNKFKDVDTLLDVLKYEFQNYKIINEECSGDGVIFKTPAEEFQLILNEKREGFSQNYKKKNKPMVILILEGMLEVENAAGNFQFSEKYKKGESFLVPALLKEFSLSCKTSSKFVIVEIPD